MAKEIIEHVEDCKLVKTGSEPNGHDCWGNYEYSSYKYVMIDGKEQHCWDGWCVIHDGKEVIDITYNQDIEDLRQSREKEKEMDKLKGWTKVSDKEVSHNRVFLWDGEDVTYNVELWGWEEEDWKEFIKGITHWKEMGKKWDRIETPEPPLKEEGANQVKFREKLYAYDVTFNGVEYEAVLFEDGSVVEIIPNPNLYKNDDDEENGIVEFIENELNDDNVIRE